jgi:hypothetical protein
MRYHAEVPVAAAKNRRSLTSVVDARPLGSLGDAGNSSGQPQARTPSESALEPLHATRRSGARHEVSARVTLRAASGIELEGWALNVSRGGLRVILEGTVELGAEYEVTIALSSPPSPGSEAASMTNALIGRVVWLQEEPDGVVAGLEFR